MQNAIKNKWFSDTSKLEIRTLFIIQNLLPHDNFLSQYKKAHPEVPYKNSVDIYMEGQDYAIELDPLYTHTGRSRKDVSIGSKFAELFQKYHRFRESGLRLEDDKVLIRRVFDGYWNIYVDTSKPNSELIEEAYAEAKIIYGEDFDLYEEDLYEDISVTNYDFYYRQEPLVAYEWARAIMYSIHEPEWGNQKEVAEYEKWFTRSPMELYKLNQMADKSYSKLYDRHVNGNHQEFYYLCGQVFKNESLEAMKRLESSPYWMTRNDLNIMKISRPIPDLHLAKIL